jgi:hypothetical protein
MNTPVASAIPSFADLQANTGQPPQSVPDAPSGGATQPSVPASQPGGGSLPAGQQAYVHELEKQGRVPVGRFSNDQDLIEALYGTAEDLATRVEQYQSAAPVQPVTPEPPKETKVAPSEVAKMATVFQQNGWLTLKDGQWVAVNPMATQVATQMNTAIMEAQARQFEMAGDPEAYISKYGEGAIKKHLDPLNDQITQLREQNQRLQSLVEAAAPRADKSWVAENRDKLFTKDATGAETHTPAGMVYAEAWEIARQAGKSLEGIHKFALSMTTPYLSPGQPAAQPPAAPAQPWSQQVIANPRTEPGFTAPGTVLQNSAPSNGISIPTGNDGYPTFSSLQGLGIQAR